MSPPTSATEGEIFTRLLLENQRRISGLIFSLVPVGPDADDVLQETCAVAWRKFGEFEPGSDFGAWALRIARFQVMTYYNRRRRAQARLSDQTIESIADTLAQPRWQPSTRAEALRSCLSQLKPREFELVQHRYTDNERVEQIAAALGASVHAIYKALSRLHVRLLACVQAKLRTEELA